MNLFILTLRFLTRIPIPVSETEEFLSPEEFAKGVIWFPAVGLIVGFFCWIAFYITEWLFGGMISILFAVFMNLLVTGAFHLDGLADTCDGLFSSRKKERMLEIMRDSRIGTNGAIAVIFDILFRIFLLFALKDSFLVPAMILAPVAGKMAMPLLFQSQYARKGEGIGNLYFGIGEKRMIATIAFGAFLILLFLGYSGILPVVLSLLAMEFYRRFVEKRIDGMTGDTLGAGSEFIEIFFCMVLVWEGRFF